MYHINLFNLRIIYVYVHISEEDSSFSYTSKLYGKICIVFMYYMFSRIIHLFYFTKSTHIILVLWRFVEGYWAEMRHLRRHARKWLRYDEATNSHWRPIKRQGGALPPLAGKTSLGLYILPLCWGFVVRSRCLTNCLNQGLKALGCFCEQCVFFFFFFSKHPGQNNVFLNQGVKKKAIRGL